MYGSRMLQTFVNLHGGMQHGNDVIIRFPVATTKEDRSEGINIGTKVQWRDNSHVGKKSEKEVKEIWAVCWRLECLHELKLFIRQRLEKAGKKGGGREVFEGRNNL